MTRRKSLSDIGVAALKPRVARYAMPDTELRGHYVRVQPSGAKSFVVVARDPHGKQVWATIGAAGVLTIGAARARAREAIQRITAGLPAFEAPAATPNTFKAVAENWLKRHVHANGLRSERQIGRLLNLHVFPVWGDRDFLGIRRSDVARLLDAVEDNHSARQADRVLTVIRSMMNWFATREDDYTPPIVRGMNRQDPKARSRILADDEIRAIWNAAEASGTFGAILKTCLLTAQRRTKVVTMRWGDVIDDEWNIPREPREKQTAGVLVLPDAARAVLRSQLRMGSNPFVFAGRGEGHFNDWDRGKKNIDAKLPADMPAWVIHDLRRSARSLMARAGIADRVAEKVLGHVTPGIEGVYNRHGYDDEKADALRRLAALVETIINPSAANVVSLRSAAR